ncbi:hypothetical protein [Sulfoacidibacillus thermotolerans]|uniref:Uncharacterized protein n=1 Tax=Sulfoacidibacillus thermotolerans TaxID=1765684 RepID=A0A2U3D888_SULT2|nr:hypothetical protein [Sulfoacidibacillus thermotolerans]PWI57492.1 hypothetical protein BM613_08450 [Sulfoacidibacillus thermotolerans]
MSNMSFTFWLLYQDSTATVVPFYEKVVANTVSDAIASFASLYSLQTNDVQEDHHKNVWRIWFQANSGDYVKYEVHVV